MWKFFKPREKSGMSNSSLYEPSHNDHEFNNQEASKDELSKLKSEYGDISVIGPTIEIKGELNAEENLLIQGKIEGTINHKSKILVIGEEGAIKANINGSRVVIEGSIEGDIKGSDAIVIKSDANMKGDIFSPRVGIEEGAKFKGSIDMDVGSNHQKSSKDNLDELVNDLDLAESKEISNNIAKKAS